MLSKIHSYRLLFSDFAHWVKELFEFGSKKVFDITNSESQYFRDKILV